MTERIRKRGTRREIARLSRKCAPVIKDASELRNTTDLLVDALGDENHSQPDITGLRERLEKISTAHKSFLAQAREIPNAKEKIRTITEISLLARLMQKVRQNLRVLEKPRPK